MSYKETMRVIKNRTKMIGYAYERIDSYNNMPSGVFVTNMLDDDRDREFDALFEGITIKLDRELRVFSGDDVKTSRNRNGPNRDSDPILMLKNGKFDYTFNDVVQTPIEMVFNFTEKNIVVGTRDGFKKMYVPITDPDFEHMSGRVVIITSRYFNNPVSVRRLTGEDYYPENMYKKMLANEGTENKDVMLCLKFLIDNRKNILDNNLLMKYANCIIVNSVTEISPNETTDEDMERGVYLEDRDMIVRHGDLTDRITFPVGNIQKVPMNAVCRTLKENEIICFINDPVNEVGDRYTLFAGAVVKIPKTGDLDLPAGLYVMVGNGEYETVCSIDQIKDNRYVHKSREEALEGGDVITLKEHERKLELASRQDRHMDIKHEQEMAKLKSSKEEYEYKLEAAKRAQELKDKEVEDRERKLKEEAEARERSHEADMEKIREEQRARREKHQADMEKLHEEARMRKEKHDADMDALRRELEDERRKEKVSQIKHNNDMSKLDREAMIEGVKTVAGVVTAGTLLYMTYQKLTKD